MMIIIGERMLFVISNIGLYFTRRICGNFLKYFILKQVPKITFIKLPTLNQTYFTNRQ
jgi:hypothetical protein